MNKRAFWPLLLSGMFSLTQINIGGNIGLSELYFCVVAPFLLVMDQETIKRDGFAPLLWLSFLVIVGCALACFANRTPLPFALKGFATTYVTFASIVFYHHYLRQNLDGVKWVLLGMAISSIINIFVFHYGAEGDAFAQNATGLAAARNIAGGTLFWLGRLEHWLLLPTKGWYLSTPLIYSAFAPVGIAIYAIVGTGSGRSAALGVLGGCAFVLMGARSRRRMRLISRHFMTFLLCAACGIAFLKGFYMYLGKNKLLPDKQQEKFLSQTGGGTRTGTLQLLMAGRTEFFCGLYAAIKQPLCGYGPWPIDYDHLYSEFVQKYGNEEDLQVFMAEQEFAQKQGRFGLIPSHSVIIEFWHWYSIFGLIFWVYILRQMYVYLRRDISAVPQWFGYLAMTMPAMLWHIFFSPYGGRSAYALYFVVLMFNRAVAEHRIGLPSKMMREAVKGMKD